MINYFDLFDSLQDTTQDPRISDLARRVGFKYYQILRKFEDFKGLKNYAATCMCNKNNLYIHLS